MSAANATKTTTIAPYLRIAFFAVVIYLGIFLGRQALQIEGLREAVVAYGYPGLFLLAFVCGFNVIVPVPAVAFLPLFVASGLNFYAVIAIIVVGTTCADLIAFYLGHLGRALPQLRDRALLRKLDRLRERHYYVPLAWMFAHASLAPFPNEVLAIPLGLVGYPLRHVAPVILAGNLVFNTLASYGVLAVFNVTT